MEDIRSVEKGTENKESAVQEAKEESILPLDVTSVAKTGDVCSLLTVTSPALSPLQLGDSVAESGDANSLITVASPTLSSLQWGESVARKITEIGQRTHTVLDAPDDLQHRLHVMEARLSEQQRTLSDVQNTIVQTSHHCTDQAAPESRRHPESERSANMMKDERRDPVCPLQLSNLCDDLRSISKQQIRLASQIGELRDAQQLLRQSTYPLLTDLQRHVRQVRCFIEPSHPFPEDHHPCDAANLMDHPIKRRFVCRNGYHSSPKFVRVLPEEGDCRDLGSRTPPMYESDRYR